MSKLTTQDIIGIIVIILGLILVGMGKNSFIQYLLTAVVCYYFGRRAELTRKLRER